MSLSRYILLPKGRIAAGQLSSDRLGMVYDRVSVGGTAMADAIFPELPHRPFSLLDSINEDGPKLTEMDSHVADAINRSGPLRAVPEVIYNCPDPIGESLKLSATATAAGNSFAVQCDDSVTGQPIAGLTVIAFDNFAARTGDQGTTDASGKATLRLIGTTIDRLYVLAVNGYWGAFRHGLAITSPINLAVIPLSANYVDAIRSIYTTRRFTKSTGIRVAVLDTGVGPHSNLNVVDGLCTATGQPAKSYQDIAEHGTHVAGLIGGDGTLGTATLGLAPGVALYALRVFDWFNGKLGASNYAILKAMILAGSKFQCDILNLSLGGGPYDPIVEEAIEDARNQGMLVVVAAGNDYRGAVSYPAAYAGATAVSAMGRETCFPAGSYFDVDVQRPPNGTASPLDYIAAFSNVGTKVACTGLGSGVLSTLPHNCFGPMSGTSMATPMVAGAVASLLSNDMAVFGMARDRSRSNAIERLLQTNCRQFFGGGIWEGYGLPNPSAV